MSIRRKLRQKASFRPSRFEKLEDRRMLAAFELSSLLAENGGDGSAGFVASHSEGTAGLAVAVAGDVNHDGYDDFLIGAPSLNTVDQSNGKGRKKGELYEGAVFVVYGDSGGMPAELDLSSLDPTNGFVINGNPDDAAGPSVAGTGGLLAAGGDINGDGIDDFAILSTTYGADRNGRAYIVYGNAAWGSTEFPATLELQSLRTAYGGDGSQGFVVNGDNSFNFGVEAASVAMNGDVNGDNISDLIIGSAFSSPAADPGTIADRPGQAFVVFGRNAADPMPAEISLSSLDGSSGFVINGATASDRLGRSVSIGGDLNGDAIDDIVVGASWMAVDGRTRAGRTFVIYGGQSFSNVFDINTLAAGDGSSGFVINGIDGDSPSGARGDVLGLSAYSGGDFNNDGIDDLALGAPRAARDTVDTEVGEGYIVFGRDANDPGIPAFPAIVELSNLNVPNVSSGVTVNGVTVKGVDAGDNFARQVALGDVNGDGIADMILTAPGGDPDGRTDAGEAYIVFGSSDVPAGGIIDAASIASGSGESGFVVNGNEAGEALGGEIPTNSRFGQTLAIGHFNGDEFADVALGTMRGINKAYMVFGSTSIVPPPPAPSFSINDVTVTEGDSGTVTADFTITRGGDTSGIDTVSYATEDGTASAGSDFTAIGLTPLTFPAGETSLAVTVIIHGDTGDQTDETFFVNLTNPSAGASVTDGQGVGTILDDDAPISVDAIYVYDIRFDSQRGGKDYRAVFEIRNDSDAPMAGVSVTVTFTGVTYSGTTDFDGIFRTDWIRKLSSGDYYAEAVDLALTNFNWNPLLDVPGDYDTDGLPDALLSV